MRPFEKHLEQLRVEHALCAGASAGWFGTLIALLYLELFAHIGSVVCYQLAIASLPRAVCPQTGSVCYQLVIASLPRAALSKLDSTNEDTHKT